MNQNLCVPELLFVTPEMAEKFLANNPNNRTVSLKRVEMFAKCMQSGRWHLTHQGIAFNGDGSLKDGQHRLHAIIKAGTGQPFWVFRGLSDEAMEGVDYGGGRTAADVLTLGGIRATKAHVAVARRMMVSITMEANVARYVVMDFYRKHIESVQFAIDLGDSAGQYSRIRHASVLGAIGRAYYTRDHGRLRQFIGCLSSGVVSSDEDRAAAALYRVLFTQGNSFGSHTERTILYRKTCSALVAFLERRPLSQLYESSREPFQIPE